MHGECLSVIVVIIMSENWSATKDIIISQTTLLSFAVE